MRDTLGLGHLDVDPTRPFTITIHGCCGIVVVKIITPSGSQKISRHVYSDGKLENFKTLNSTQRRQYVKNMLRTDPNISQADVAYLLNYSQGCISLDVKYLKQARLL